MSLMLKLIGHVRPEGSRTCGSGEQIVYNGAFLTLAPLHKITFPVGHRVQPVRPQLAEIASQIDIDAQQGGIVHMSGKWGGGGHNR